MGCHPTLHRGTETYAYAPAGRLRKPESPQIAWVVLVGQWATCHLKPLANGSEKVAAPPIVHCALPPQRYLRIQSDPPPLEPYTTVSAAIRSLCLPGTLEIVKVEEAHREENPAAAFATLLGAAFTETGCSLTSLSRAWVAKKSTAARQLAGPRMHVVWVDRGADLGRPRFPSSLKSPDVVQPTEPTTAAGIKSDLDASTLAYLLHWQRYRMMACDSASYPMRQIHATSSLLFE
ncbi:hypothetical protein CPAR01_13410 [Colletotrichum paranaense]|uniref:Uncharacterized protein n=1 Tax=Colletotrichum paranaense TaxID=1914294 RepID=A0ABQ9S770_9PEZI|nr:uncharacterized protein CPAR01_13410 [Colletotrichum paranaense]KAK1526882.1 hypothetical protein CPAR01_13410 [Colletotrichum paranaense]